MKEAQTKMNKRLDSVQSEMKAEVTEMKAAQTRIETDVSEIK